MPAPMPAPAALLKEKESFPGLFLCPSEFTYRERRSWAGARDNKQEFLLRYKCGVYKVRSLAQDFDIM